MFKTEFGMEKYLCALNPHLCIALCKYRTSNHKLEIEKLRYVFPRIPRIHRKCRQCNLNETGNEYHHIMICPNFNALRNRFIPREFLARISFISFLNLMCSRNPQTMANLAKFIYFSMRNY